jgi:putative membrane protein
LKPVLGQTAATLAGLPAFLVYFCRNNNPAAAIALGLSLLGFSLPLISAIAHSANVSGPGEA